MLLLLVTLLGVALDAAAPQRWTAVSNTAMSITGDVTFTPSALIFVNGKRLTIRYLKDVSGKVSFSSSVPATVHARLYQVLSSSDLTLLGGNRFCGQPPKYISVLEPSSPNANDTDIFLTVYAGSVEPTGTPRDVICAGYTYSAPAGSTAAEHRVLVATPEHAFDLVHVGDTYVVPIFDGQIADVVAPVKKIDIVRIGYHSFTLTNSIHVGSNRGVAFLITGTGHGTILVALRAPQLAMQCSSCRTVHYFFRASP